MSCSRAFPRNRSAIGSMIADQECSCLKNKVTAFQILEFLLFLMQPEFEYQICHEVMERLCHGQRVNLVPYRLNVYGKQASHHVSTFDKHILGCLHAYEEQAANPSSTYDSSISGCLHAFSCRMIIDCLRVPLFRTLKS
jgi:hypothetical protein